MAGFADELMKVSSAFGNMGAQAIQGAAAKVAPPPPVAAPANVSASGNMKQRIQTSGQDRSNPANIRLKTPKVGVMGVRG